MNAIQRGRLLNVARALREASGGGFTMERFGNQCGTPACALGHYAARRDLQRSFFFEASRNGVTWIDDSTHELLGVPVPMFWVTDGEDDLAYDDPMVQGHFGIDEGEAHALFGNRGCGLAKTRRGAANFIERFVARRTP